MRASFGRCSRLSGTLPLSFSRRSVSSSVRIVSAFCSVSVPRSNIRSASSGSSPESSVSCRSILCRSPPISADTSRRTNGSSCSFGPLSSSRAGRKVSFPSSPGRNRRTSSLETALLSRTFFSAGSAASPAISFAAFCCTAFSARRYFPSDDAPRASLPGAAKRIFFSVSRRNSRISVSRIY